MGNKDEYKLADVVIFEAGSTARVHPAYFRIARGSPIVFRNLTGGEVKLFFPAPAVFTAKSFSIRAGGDMTVSVAKEAAYGLYPYAAYSEKAGDFAVGASSPGIIIEH